MLDRGLDLESIDSLSEAEASAFREFYSEKFGGSLSAYELWFGLRPDVLKMHRRQAVSGAPAGVSWPTLLYLHHYAVVGFGEGISYQIENARACGFTRDQVIAVLAVAFMHSGPAGMAEVARAADLLDDFREVDAPQRLFPAEWTYDRDAFSSGIDFTTMDVGPGELDAILRWYRSTLGEVPDYVTFMAEHAPRLLKAFRCRIENTVRDALPAQMLPLLLLHLHVSRGSAEGIREALLLARSLEVRRQDAVWAICGGMMHGGTAAVSLAQRVAGDVLMTMSDDGDEGGGH